MNIPQWYLNAINASRHGFSPATLRQRNPERGRRSNSTVAFLKTWRTSRLPKHLRLAKAA
jgi:hypothetical protein